MWIEEAWRPFIWSLGCYESNLYTPEYHGGPCSNISASKLWALNNCLGSSPLLCRAFVAVESSEWQGVKVAFVTEWS